MAPDGNSQTQTSRTGGIIAYFANHGTAANLLMAMLVVMGLVAAPELRSQFYPDVVLDSIEVRVNWSGAGPQDIDTAIVGVMLPALQGINGVETSYSVSRLGFGKMELDFEPDWDMARAMRDVEAAVATVTDLPADAELPIVRRHAWRDRVTDVVITGPVGVDQLARFADDLVQKLFNAGVTDTSIRGVAAPETTIVVETQALIRHDIGLADIAAAISAEASTTPSGDVDAANARLRSGSQRRSPDEIAAIVLRSNPDGTTLRVGDLAIVQVGGIDRDEAYFVRNDPAVKISVNRTAQGDAIALQATVEKVASEAMLSLPPDVQIDLIRTRSEQITARLKILLENGLAGLAMVLGLLFLFLNARTAFWVAAGIPVAMMTAISLMYLFGLSLNMVSLFGLIITLGIVVDDAIVVGEHADFRARHLGEAPAVAAVNAARRMSLPVFSATLTTVIAFAALTLIEGRFGELIRDIPVTVVAVLAASLVECFLILPNHMRHALAHRAKEHWYDWPSRQFNRGFGWVREHLFRPLIGLVIIARYPVIAGALLLLSTQVVLLLNDEVRWQFFYGPERGTVNGNFAMAPGATRDDTDAQLREFQRATETVAARFEAEHGRNPLDYVLSVVGGTSGRGLSGQSTKDRDQLGSVSIELIDADLRPYSSSAFVQALQEEVQRLPLAETVSFRRFNSGPGGDTLDVELYGASTAQLKAASEALKREVQLFPEVSGVQDNLAWDKDELLLDLTPQAQVLGFDIGDVGQVLRERLNGIEAVTYPVGLRTARIRVEVPEDEKTADFLERMVLRAPSGQYLPLADLVTAERAEGFSHIRRKNGLHAITINGDIAEDDPARAAEIVRALETRILPEIESTFQISYKVAGLAEQEEAFLTDAVVGFTLCLLGIFLTLAWIFSSWSRPLVIMAIIPFGLVGAIWGHYIWEVPMSIFTVIGLIGMTGIIINDSIVLVSTVDDYSQTRGLRPAIVDAVCDRLRPVLLTTLTTVLGLSPLLYETSTQAQFLKPTVITLVYGLAFGVFMVLLVVPALLAAGQDFAQSVRSARRAFGRGAGATRGAVVTLSLTLAVWFAATLGGQIVTGQMPAAVILGIPPVPFGQSALAFAMFSIGAILVTLAILVGSAILAVVGQAARHQHDQA